MNRVFAFGPRDRGSIPGRVILKTQKMVLDTFLLNTLHYNVRIKVKTEQSRELSSALPYASVAPSTTSVSLLKRETSGPLRQRSPTLLAYSHLHSALYGQPPLKLCTHLCIYLGLFFQAIFLQLKIRTKPHPGMRTDLSLKRQRSDTSPDLQPQPLTHFPSWSRPPKPSSTLQVPAARRLCLGDMAQTRWRIGVRGNLRS